MTKFELGPRGLLSNYPPEVIAVVNGHPITKNDILHEKRSRQRRILTYKLRRRSPVIKPCFVWVFRNDGFPYTGWWLYVKTLKMDWGIGFQRRHQDLMPEIMAMWPCGLLPIAENFELWAVAFADAYHYPTRKRPQNQGMVQAWARIDSYGGLLEVRKQNLGKGR